MKPFYLLCFSFSLLLISSEVYAQSIDNIRLLQKEGDLLILYDLWPGAQPADYLVAVYYSIDGGQSYRGPARKVSGDLESVRVGPDHKISWQIHKEIGSGLFSQFQVELRLQVDKGPELPPWLGEMTLVKGGTFEMGSNEGEENEKPTHQVRLPDFWIGKYEITQKEWTSLMGHNPSSFNCPDCPVEKVSWKDVQVFIRKLNLQTGLEFRLPTEAEWEYAAKGGQYSLGQTYAGSNWPEQVAWYSDNSDSKTHPVGQKEPNELGLYDMNGNVWEWCQDRWHLNYEGAPTDGSAWKEGSNSQRVLRGGGWGSPPAYLRVSNRLRYDPGYRYFDVGFRLARTR